MSKNQSSKLVEITRQKIKDLKAGQLVINISGKDVTSTVVNAIRRTALNDVPTYAFYKDGIIIEKNTSVFDNDYMRLRLEQMTVPNLEVKMSYLEDKYCDSTVNYADPNREKHPEDDILSVLSVNKTNRTDAIISVTTNDAKYYENNELVSKKFNKDYPLLLVKLKPGESFICTSTALLGCGRRNNIWAAAANFYYEQVDNNKDLDEDDPHEFTLTVESQGQLDEYDILIKSCDAIIYKLKNIVDTFDSLVQITDSEDKANRLYLEISMPNTSHTTAALINEFLQLNKGVEFSGVSKPDLLKESMLIKMQSVKNDPGTLFFEVVDQITNLFEDIKKQLVKLAR